MLSEEEKTHVYDTYQTISNEFDRSRGYIWSGVSDFLDSLQSGCRLLEIGCGNGKNLLYRSDLNSIGVDFVPNFVDICTKKGLNVLTANALELPFDDNSFDAVISVAVFHHLSTEERRRKALIEMNRVLKPNGKGLVVCWAYEQEMDGYTSIVKTKNKRVIEKGDQYISWRAKQKNQLGERFYYFYDKDDFISFTNSISVKDKTISWEEGNWLFTFSK